MNAYVRNALMIAAGVLWGMMCVFAISWWWTLAVVPFLLGAGYFDAKVMRSAVANRDEYFRGYGEGFCDALTHK